MRMTWMVGAVVMAGFALPVASEEKQAPSVVAKPEKFRTLVNPDCSHCKDEARRRTGELKDTDRVLCWIRGRYDGGAIPYRFFLVPYRVISDTYGVFVYDTDAGYVRGFEPSLAFMFHGWRNGIMVIRHQDGTLYSALSGLAFDGPNKGKRLKPLPTLETDWGFWLKAYPDTVAYHMYPKYQPAELPAKPNEESVRTRPPADKRLPAEMPVLGVRIGTKAKAYPLSMLEKSNGVLTDTLDKKLVLFWYEPTRTAVAYRAANPLAKQSPEAVLSFKRDSKNPLAPFVDEQTGSRWDIAGRAVQGPLKGQTLEWIDSVQVRWFAWAAEYPETSIYGTK